MTFHESVGILQNLKGKSQGPNKKTGRSIFTFSNGDTYVGYYRIISPTNIVRSGHGIYICNDKTVFIGDWDDDQLVNGKVRFPEGFEYSGILHNHMFNGPGSYKSLKENWTLSGIWQNGYPSDQGNPMTLTDECNHDWIATEIKETSALFRPACSFFEAIKSQETLLTARRSLHNKT